MNKKEGVPNIVIPTIRSEEYFEKFLRSWQEEFKGCHVIVVEDRKKKILTKLLDTYLDSYDVYDWRDIDKDLGDKAWIIPRQTDCVRSYGYYKAWQNKPNMIVTLDDDVRPQEKHVENFYFKLYQQVYPPHNFISTLMTSDIPPRGTYLDNTNPGCDVAHGGWLNVLDLSAEEQIASRAKHGEVYGIKDYFYRGLIPKGSYFSLCGMNLAWKPHVTKDMYFGLQGKDYPIDRCGDIWAGYNITKKGHKVYTGDPFVTHNRASNVWSNLKKERRAKFMSSLFITWNKSDRNYSLMNWLSKEDQEYWNKLKEAYEIWEGLFKDE